MKVRLRLCDTCAVGMIRKGFDVNPMKSYQPTKGTNCNAYGCEFRGYPRVYLIDIEPARVLA